MFPHGTKPFNYRQQSDRDATELLALGQIISQQDKKEGNSEGDKSYPGSTRDDEGQDDFLNDLDDLAEDIGFNEEVRSCLGQDSDGSQVDYTSEESEAVGTLNDNEEEAFVEDNTAIENESDKNQALVEISVSTRKPVLTQQIIMELVESQASSIRTPSNVGW